MPVTNIRGQQILNGTVQYIDIQQVAASRLVGNPTGSVATMSEISLGTGLSFSGGSVILSANLQSLSGLSYSSASFVKMTAAGTFALDTNTYVTGSGTSNYVSKWTSSTGLGNSSIQDDGTGVTIGAYLYITQTNQGSIEFYPNGSSGATYSVLKAKLGSGLAPTLAFYGDVAGVHRGYGIYGADSTYDGLLIYRETGTVVDVIFMGANQVSLPSTQKLAWSSSSNSVGSLDLGLSRESSGLLQVNTGSANTYASIKASSFVKSGGTSAQILAADGSVITAGTNINISGGTISSSNSGGTVTSVGGTGTVSGLTLTGTVTTSGNLTLGGTLALTAANVNAVGAITNSTSGNAATATALTSMNISQFTNNSGYITGSYLPTTGGYGNGNYEFASDNNTATDYSTAAIELRETNRGSSGSFLPPRLGFHWGGVVASQISIESDGRIVVRNNPGTGYEKFAAGVITAYGNIIASGNRPTTIDVTDGAIYTTADTGGWAMGHYFKGSSGTILAGFGAFGSNNTLSYAWIGSAYNASWMTFSSSAANSQVALQQAGNQVLHAANYNSYAPTLTGTGASGTWSINVTGNADTVDGYHASIANNASYVVVRDGNGDIFSRYSFSGYVNTTDNDVTGITRFVVKNGDDYHRSATTTTAANIIRGVASGDWAINVFGYSGRVLARTVTNVNTQRTTGSLEYYDVLDTTGAPSTGWYSFISVRHGNDSNQYGFQFANGFGNETLYWRGWDGANPLTWRVVLHSGNVSSYAVTSLSGETLQQVMTRGASSSTYMTLTGGGAFSGNEYKFISSIGSGVYLGNTTTVRLQAFSDDGGAAYMTFHRGGSWAVNMGLDPDNVLRIGGFSAAANRLQLDMSGNLTVAGSVTSTTNITVGGDIILAQLTSPNTSTIRFGDNTGWVFRFMTSVSGTPTTRFSFQDNGTFTAVGDVIAYSDARVKTNVVTIKDSLEKVQLLRGVSYNRTDSTDDSEKIGVIAQEVQKILPQVVTEDKDGMLGVSYGNLAGVFIEAIKEQQTQIEELKKQIAYLVENR